MTEEQTTEVVIAPRARRRRVRLRLLGTLLIVYGVIGIVLFAIIAQAIGPPITAAGQLTTSLNTQRQAVIDTLQHATDTINTTATGVRGMDSSLDQAQGATTQASSISTDLTFTMHELASNLGVVILGVQPLIGLAPGFDQMATSFATLSTDLDSITTALNANRQSIKDVATSMDQLGASLARLTLTVRTDPGLSLAAGSLDSLRTVVFAVVAWLFLLAIGCVLAGVACWWYAGLPRFLAIRSRARR